MVKKIKIGILHEGFNATNFQMEIISYLCNKKSYEVYWLKLVNYETRLDKFVRKLGDRGIFTLTSDILFKLYENVENQAFNNAKSYSDKSLNLKDYQFEKTITVEYVMGKFNTCTIIQKSLNELQNLNLDFLYRSGGGGIYKGEILNLSRHGIISLHHGDNNWNRGGPPGFWEVYRALPTTGFIIQILNNNLDGGRLLHKGWCRTQRYYVRNRREISKIANHHLIDLFDQIADTPNFIKKNEKSIYIFDGIILRNPSLAALLVYLIKLFCRDTIKVIERYLLHRHHNWQIGYQVAPWPGADLRRSHVLKPPRNRFYADPFIHRSDDKICIFYEDYNYSNKKGKISCSEVKKDGEITKYEDLLKLNEHQSFPFIFECDGGLYMVPETRESRNIQLFKCRKFPADWVKVKDIFTDIDAVDTVIFQRNGIWWMLTTTADDPLGKADSKLRCFTTADAIDGEWIEHSASPLLNDPLIGRNGGLLYTRDDIYRVSQTPGFQHYGQSCCIWKINIEDDEISFTEMQSVHPNFGKKIKSIHHLHGNEDLFTFDYELK